MVAYEAMFASKWLLWPQTLNLTSYLMSAITITLASMCIFLVAVIMMASEATAAQFFLLLNGFECVQSDSTQVLEFFKSQFLNCWLLCS